MPLVNNASEVILAIKANNEASPVIKQVANDVQGLESTTQDLSDSALSSSAGFDMLGVSAGTLSLALSTVTLAASAFVAAFNFGEIAAGNERLRESGAQLAAGYGESLDRIITKVRAASLGTVSDMDIIASANKAMMLGVGGNAEQLANLMEIAAFRGRAMGLSTSQAFDDMTRGIGRMSPMILDNLGIVVDAESTYVKYAQSIGKTSNELTRNEKVQALLNRVIEEGNRQLEEAGGLVEDNASKYEKFNAELENAKNSLIENTVGMSGLADAAGNLLNSFTQITGDQSLSEFFMSNATWTNQFRIAQDFLTDSVERSADRRRQAADAVRMHSDAMDVYSSRVKVAIEVQGELTTVDDAAVKGAMQVHDTYEKLSDKLSDLESDHDALLEKKRELIEQGWWPESEKIKAVNDKLAENEQKQKDVTLAMQGTLSQMLLNTAAAGLDAEGQLALARATGQISEEAYVALTAQAALKKQYEDGRITAEQYAQKTKDLKAAIDALQSKKITITADAIFNQINKIMTSYQYIKSDGGPTLNTSGKRGYASGTQGWETVPSGYPNDTYPIMLSSGERFAVIPSGVSAAPSASGVSGGGVTLQIVYAPGISFGDESEAEQRMWPTVLKLMQQAKANGQI